MATAFLVIGTPRSGTSCVAGILHRLGLFMGDRWLSPCPMNETGFYQDVDFEEVFQGVPEWMPDAVREEHYDGAALRGLVAKRFARGGDWGAKFRHAPMVVDAFAEACGKNLKLIVTRRDTEWSKQSLARWFEPHDQDARQVIDRAAVAVDRAAGVLPSLIVPYDDLIHDPECGVARLAAFIGRRPTLEAVKFVNPGLKHYGN